MYFSVHNPAFSLTAQHSWFVNLANSRDRTTAIMVYQFRKSSQASGAPQSLEPTLALPRCWVPCCDDGNKDWHSDTVQALRVLTQPPLVVVVSLAWPRRCLLSWDLGGGLVGTRSLWHWPQRSKGSEEMAGLSLQITEDIWWRESTQCYKPPPFSSPEALQPSEGAEIATMDHGAPKGKNANSPEPNI